MCNERFARLYRCGPPRQRRLSSPRTYAFMGTLSRYSQDYCQLHAYISMQSPSLRLKVLLWELWCAGFCLSTGLNARTILDGATCQPRVLGHVRDVVNVQGVTGTCESLSELHSNHSQQ